MMLRAMMAAVALSAAAAPAMAADPAAGEKAFAVCKACHRVGEGAKNGVGPMLNGVVGRQAGAVEGYNYSDAMKESGITWDEANLAEYIKAPKTKVPGNKMVFAGVKDDAKIADIIAYLDQFNADGTKK
ncbi:c-type cytochrome [Dongia deserti]|uniref:c-type cytochrome n=1 Tax=Dongia deserti TaxID=2268030 RepID=UPI000E65417C|nr:cytochrome c family protein [Dongia deserti]